MTMRQKIASMVMLLIFAIIMTGCECDVTYDYGGILGLENKTESYKKGTTLALERNITVDAKHTLKGWAESKNGTPESFVDVDDDMTLYAIWEISYYLCISHTICNPDGTYSPFDTQRSYCAESDYTFSCNAYSSPLTDKYACIGWSFGVYGSITTDTLHFHLDRDTTIVVRYEQVYYDITYDLNGAQGTAPATMKINKGEYLNYTSLPTNSGFSYGIYTFEGWSETKNGKVITSNFKPEKDITLYAVWSHNGQVKDKTDDE